LPVSIIEKTEKVDILKKYFPRILSLVIGLSGASFASPSVIISSPLINLILCVIVVNPLSYVIISFSA